MERQEDPNVNGALTVIYNHAALMTGSDGTMPLATARRLDTLLYGISGKFLRNKLFDGAEIGSVMNGGMKHYMVTWRGHYTCNVEFW